VEKKEKGVAMALKTMRSPWEDAMVPLRGAPERSWMPGCIRNAVDADEGARLRSQWLVGIMGAFAVATLHVVRLSTALSRRDEAVQEVVVFVAAVCGVLAFLVDLQRCRTTEGMVKLVVLLFVANGLVPALWPPADPDAHELEEGEIRGVIVR
jgi:hypothetical protein